MARNGDIKISITQDTTTNFGVFHIEQENQFDVKIEQDSTVKDLEVAFIEGTSGLLQVYHSDDFKGGGTIGAPLELSEKFQEKMDAKQDKLTAGAGIEIGEDNTIRVIESFIYEQGIASDTWVVHHNLDRRPSVTVVDSAGTQVECFVDYVDENTCRICMNAPFKGKAYLN